MIMPNEAKPFSYGHHSAVAASPPSVSTATPCPSSNANRQSSSRYGQFRAAESDTARGRWSARNAVMPMKLRSGGAMDRIDLLHVDVAYPCAFRAAHREEDVA